MTLTRQVHAFKHVESASVGAYAINMSAALNPRHITVEEYLAAESASPVKREYLGGFVYAMAGAKNAHNLIASNVLGMLHARLRGTPCRPYNSDTKVRIQMPNHVRMYYPDVSVICESNPPGDTFQDRPVLVVEVLSRRTRRIDESEKREAYLTIPTLVGYLLIDQDCPAVTLYRCAEHGFVDEVYIQMEAIIPLAEFRFELPLAEIYEGVEFLPEPEEEEL